MTDLNQAFALGNAAVDLAMVGKNALMPIIERVSGALRRGRESRKNDAEDPH